MRLSPLGMVLLISMKAELLSEKKENTALLTNQEIKSLAMFPSTHPCLISLSPEEA
jgi:hypothetical protein